MQRLYIEASHLDQSPERLKTNQIHYLSDQYLSNMAWDKCWVCL